MRVVVQRVLSAGVVVDGEMVGSIGRGLCVLLGVAREDGEEDAQRLAGRVARLRIFENDEGRFDRSLLDVGGEGLRSFETPPLSLQGFRDRGLFLNRYEVGRFSGQSRADSVFVFCAEVVKTFGLDHERDLEPRHRVRMPFRHRNAKPPSSRRATRRRSRPRDERGHRGRPRGTAPGRESRPRRLAGAALVVVGIAVLGAA